MEDVLEIRPGVSQELLDYWAWQQRLMDGESFNKIIGTLARERASLLDAHIDTGVKIDKSKFICRTMYLGEAVELFGKFDENNGVEYVTLALNGCEFMVCVDLTEDDATGTDGVNEKNEDRVYVGSSGHIWAETDEPKDWSVDALVNSAEAREKVEQVFDGVASKLGPF